MQLGKPSSMSPLAVLDLPLDVILVVGGNKQQSMPGLYIPSCSHIEDASLSTLVTVKYSWYSISANNFID